MELDKLLAEIEKARKTPLRVCCRTPAGELIVTSVEDCARRGCRYFHIVADDLDALLDAGLNNKTQGENHKRLHPVEGASFGNHDNQRKSPVDGLRLTRF